MDKEDGTKTARKFPLLDADGEPVATLDAAKEAMEVLRHSRRENALPTSGHKPSLADYVETYFAKAEVGQKKARTIDSQRQALKRWKAHLGDVRIDRITQPMISTFKDKRLRAGTSPRTVNLDQIALRNVLKWARKDGYLRELPKLDELTEAQPPKRNLLTPSELDRLLSVVPGACEKNAVQVTDYLRFLAYSGCREQEALHIRWVDVDLVGERVMVGAGLNSDGDKVTKNSERRAVEFNDRLGTLLNDMAQRRAPDCSWLFPSPHRGPRDEHAKTFRESLRLARTAAKLDWLGFHDLRHCSASFCVMAGLDFMTIAAWLGHKDGGILVGKVYGHLMDDHRRQAARKVRFDLPTPTE